MQTSGEPCREIAKSYPAVIASEAKQSISRHTERIDCFASLAMTWEERTTICRLTLRRPRSGRLEGRAETATPHQPFNFAIQAMSTFKFLK